VEWKGDTHGTIRAAIAKVRGPSMRLNNRPTHRYQTTWPLEDITKNFRYFLSAVRKATGNTRNLEAEAKGQVKQGQSKPIPCVVQRGLIRSTSVNPLTRVILSSNHGPGIHIADF
jgi:large subunit ribosomal protein L1